MSICWLLRIIFLGYSSLSNLPLQFFIPWNFSSIISISTFSSICQTMYCKVISHLCIGLSLSILHVYCSIFYCFTILFFLPFLLFTLLFSFLYLQAGGGKDKSTQLPFLTFGHSTLTAIKWLYVPDKLNFLQKFALNIREFMGKMCLEQCT